MNRCIQLRQWNEGTQTFIPLLHPDQADSPLVVECTGVRDYFGRLIWEGDVVKWAHYDEAERRYREEYYSVVFRHGCFGTLGSAPGSEFMAFEKDQVSDSVVGHVFAHAYLLKQHLDLVWETGNDRYHS